MRHKIASTFAYVAWTVIPSVLWSAVFHNISVCLDPMFLSQVEARCPRWAALLLRSIWTMLLVIALLFAWNITPGSYAFYVREALPFSPPSVLASIFICLILLTWFVLSRSPSNVEKPKHITLAIGVILLVFKFVSVAGLVDIGWVREYVRSPLIGLGRMIKDERHADSGHIQGEPRHTFSDYVQRNVFLPPKVVFMLVESWGERSEELNMISSEIGRTTVQVMEAGHVPYEGSTLSGELRELCSVRVLPNSAFSAIERLHCAPETLRGRGYDTWAMHGYNGNFYARDSFWRRFGIAHMLFQSNLPSLKSCDGPFAGVCDDALIHEGIRILNRTGEHAPTFLYLLTLSSHEPLPSTIKISSSHFSTIPVLHPTQNVTRSALSVLISELEAEPTGPCTLAYVVGDHQPPSASSAGLFPAGFVPYLVLEHNCPKQADAK